MNEIIRQRSEARKQRLTARLDKGSFPEDLSQPMLRAAKVHYEVAGRAVSTAYGDIGLIHQLTRELDLAREIDRRVQLFKIHLPYYESDHVLNLAYNALCGGQCLEDLELRRQDEAYVNTLGPLVITRGSHVEPTSDGQWQADLSPVNGPYLGPFANRSDALTGERTWLEANWLVRQ